MELRIQYIVRHALPLQHRRQIFRLGDGGRPHQHRLSLGMQFGDFRHRRLVFPAFRFVDDIGKIIADHRLMRRNHDDIQLVYLAEFLFLGLRRPGHPGQFLVHAEIVLERNGSERLALALDLHALFGFDGLVQPVRITAAEHEASSELIHDDDFAVFDHIVFVSVHQTVRPQRLVEMMRQFHIFIIVQVPDVQRLFRLGDARFRRCYRVQLLIDSVVFAFF